MLSLDRPPKPMNPPPKPPWVVRLRDKCTDFDGVESDRVAARWRDRVFIDYLDRILTAASPASQQAAIAKFFKWMMGNYRIRGILKKVENLADRQEIANDLQMFIVEKVGSIPFTGKTATGSFFHLVANRLNFDILDYFHDRGKNRGRTADIPEEKEVDDFLKSPTISGLDAFLENDGLTATGTTVGNWKKAVGTSTLPQLDRVLAECNRCTCRDVLYRLYVKEPPEEVKDLVADYSLKEQQVYGFRKDWVLPTGQFLFLEPEVLTGELPQIVRETIDADDELVLQKPISKDFPKVTVQFMAQNRLWFYENPEDFEEISRRIVEAFGKNYAGISMGKLESFWEDKCWKIIGKVAAVVLEYYD
jgi:hypothetical protein